jgi:DNA gyrase subunit A
LIEVKLTNGDKNIILASRYGKSIRFHESDVRVMGRTATGVKGMTLPESDNYIVGMVCVAESDEDTTVMVVAENGIGKRTVLDEYRTQSRGGKGIKTINVTDKTGKLVAIKSVTDNDDFVIINRSGIIIRLAVKNVPTTGRATQGVKLINLRKNDSIADIGLIVDGQLEEVEEEADAENGDGNVGGNSGELSDGSETSQEHNDTDPTNENDAGNDDE